MLGRLIGAMLGLLHIAAKADIDSFATCKQRSRQSRIAATSCRGRMHIMTLRLHRQVRELLRIELESRSLKSRRKKRILAASLTIRAREMHCQLLTIALLGALNDSVQRHTCLRRPSNPLKGSRR